MNIGDILLFKDEEPPFWSIANLVRLVTGSPYYHAALMYDPVSSVLAEAQAEGFILRKRLELFDFINRGRIEVYRLKEGLDLEDTFRVPHEIEKRYKQSYGFHDLLGIMFYYLLTNNLMFPKSPRQMTCSEAVERVYRAIGHPLVPDKSPDVIIPGDYADNPLLEKIMEVTE